ncbi:MAG: U32 family peptidase [Bacteroidaceae bacterium]|nr:U32 family peptidase [Bacteroidaceae bacterium]
MTPSPYTPSDFEIMAPVGSPESFTAALQAGADSIYFGIEQLNMRAHSASHFTIADLQSMAAQCHAKGVKAYLTVNTIIYQDDLAQMRTIIDAAHAAGIDAVIAADVAVLTYCRSVGQEVHLSTQLNISNVEALKFYAQWADVVVLARELTMPQVAEIYAAIERDNICGPSGRPIRIEMFVHGALCMAISGKCYLSLQNTGRSANRGQCMQICRRGYVLTDAETGDELLVDNKYIMSPKDLKTIRFLDIMMRSGVRVMKIEGRARSAEYVHTVVSCYREALQAVCDGTFTPDKCDQWDARLATVFNRGFWDGYYQGARLGEWSSVYGSQATERKVYVGKCTNYFSKLGVAEFTVEATDLNLADRLLITGPTTGAVWLTLDEMRYDYTPIPHADQGTRVSFPVPSRVRPADKLFKIITVTTTPIPTSIPTSTP